MELIDSLSSPHPKGPSVNPKWKEYLQSDTFHKKLTKEYLEYFYQHMTFVRRDFHQYPELGFEEYRTQSRIVEELIEIAQIPKENIHICAKTGLIINIYGTLEEKDSNICTKNVQCIALRADMDCLPMTEENDHLPYASKYKKRAHMCGHDGHVASLLGAAILLQRASHRLPKGKCIRLLFQPGEEGYAGAKEMIKQGCLDKVEEIYGYHNFNQRIGLALVKSGPVLAHSARFQIKLRGSGGHGSAPQDTTDPVIVASQLVQSIQTIVSRNCDPFEPAVISVTQIHAGEADNVIPTTAELSGTIRDLNPKIFEMIKERMTQLVKSTTQAYCIEGVLDFVDGYPCTVNTEEETKHVKHVLTHILGNSNVSEKGLPVLGGEDFSYYLLERPGCFFMLGGAVKNKEETGKSLHSSHFGFNDELIPLASRVWIELVENRFECQLYTEEEKNLIYFKNKIP